MKIHNIFNALCWLVCAIVLLLAGCSPCSGAESKILPLDEGFVKALHMKEASGNMNPKDGDGGRAIGPFQIWKAYWQDAVEYDKTIGGTYQDCRNYDYAKRVVAAYLNRYARRAVQNRDFETLARLHNGGPSWKKRPVAVVATQAYWKVLSRYLPRS